MILTNTLLVHAQAAEALRVAGPEREQLREAMEAVLSHRLPDATFSEMPGPDPQSLVSRHRVPGHGIEGIWVILESLDLLGDERDRAPLLESLEALCELGWDREHGGLLRYCDREGPVAPQGTASGTRDEEVVSSRRCTKMWWVHSKEAEPRASAAQH